MKTSLYVTTVTKWPSCVTKWPSCMSLLSLNGPPEAVSNINTPWVDGRLNGYLKRLPVHHDIWWINLFSYKFVQPPFSFTANEIVLGQNVYEILWSIIFINSPYTMYTWDSKVAYKKLKLVNNCRKAHTMIVYQFVNSITT